MTDFSKATPRPWGYDISSQEIIGPKGEKIGGLDSGLDDLASIKAVNNHEQMIEALKAAQAALAMMVDETTITSTSTALAYANCIQAEAKARAAIAAAEGDKS